MTTTPRNIAELTNPRTPANPHAVADAIEASGDAARDFMADLRQQTRGEPDATIDTNAYTYNGDNANLPIPADQAAAASQAQDVGSLAAVRRGMEGLPNPEAAWQRFREHQMEAAGGRGSGHEVSPEMARMQAEVRQRIETDLRLAEEMHARVQELETAAAERLVEQGTMQPDSPGIQARAREEAAAGVRDQLVAELRNPQPNYQRVRELQSIIKMLETGAYVSPDAYADVVQHQQRMRDDPVVDDEAAAGSRRVYDAGPATTDLGSLVRSIRDSLGQLAAHLGPGHSTISQVKAIAKYCLRIDHARMAAGLEPHTTEIQNHFSTERLNPESTSPAMQAALRQMVVEWADGRGLGGRSFEEQAAAYISYRFNWAQHEAARMGQMSMTREAMGGSAAPATERLEAGPGTPIPEAAPRTGAGAGGAGGRRRGAVRTGRW